MSANRKRASRETMVHHPAPRIPSIETTLNSEEQPQRRLAVRIKRFHAVARWSWNAGEQDDICSICQNAFESTAPGIKYPGEDCPVVFGKCKHAFHLQCVSKWLNQATSKNSCPVCRQDWEFGSNPTATISNTASTGNNNVDSMSDL